jgi:pilus assembly protein TadC
VVRPSRVLPGAAAALDRPARSGGPAGADPAERHRSRLGTRRSARPTPADPALLLDLVAVALAAGAPVPTALSAVGAAWPGTDGEALARAARSLALGAPWDVAWTGAVGAARAVAEALRPAWSAGASPVPLLRSAADRLRSRRRAEIRAATGRLGVRLVVPLGLCYLPAFVLVGLVPVVVSLGAGLLG